MKMTGWNRDTLATLRRKIRNANCISVCNGQPFEIGWRRSGFNMFIINLYKTSEWDSAFSGFDNKCVHPVPEDKAILRSASGAVGSDCLPDQ